MLNLFSAETALENNLSDDQIRTVIDALRREGKVQEVIYHTENKESSRYVITTEIVTNTGDKLVQATTSVEKFKLQEDEFLEFVQDTLDGGLVREKKYTLPLQEEEEQACQECLRPIAVKHLRCINKIEKLLSSPRPRPVIKESGARTTFLLFTMLIALIGAGLFFLRPLLTNKESADLTLLFNTVNVKVWLGTEPYTTDGNRLDLTLPLARYRLQAEKPGFKPIRRDIFLTTDEEIGIRLEEIHTLTVYADMEDSRVLLDGNTVGATGKTTPLELSLTEGEYNLSLINPAVSRPFEEKILLQEDQIIHAELPHPQLVLHLNVDDVLLTVGEKEYQVQGKELALKLPVGTYQVMARKPGYLPAQLEASIETQDIDLPINLEAIQYRLSITPNVENSSISVSCTNEQKYFGLASPDKPFQIKSPPQTCTVLAEKQGYQHMSKEVSLTADQELSLTLKKLFLVTVYTNLDLSTVMLDGKEVDKAGSKTPAALSIPSGKYLINISNPQAAAPVEQQLEVTKDQRLNIDMPLPKLTVKVNKAGTILIVDGKEYKVSGKQLHLELPQGSHHITAKKEGYATLQREVLVRDGAQTFFELLPPTYPLSVRSNIDKAAIYVKCKDGKEYTGIASPDEPFLFKATAGTCTVSASREGYQQASKPTALPTEKEITLNLIPEEQKKIQPPEKKDQPVVQVVQPEEQVNTKKNEPVVTEQPVEQPAEQEKTKTDEPAAVEQPVDQPIKQTTDAKDKPVVVEQPVEQSKTEKIEPTAAEEPAEQPSKQPKTEKNKPAVTEQPAEQKKIEEKEPAFIEIKPRKLKTKQEAAQKRQKTKSKPAPRQPKIKKTTVKKQPVSQENKEQPAVQPEKKPTPAPKETDPLKLKQKKKDCQYEISIGMPELCDE
ncbi:MAG: PEGA domain-containing protein [Candidatus Electrothrix aestuarii]|uniref:PEGA domain-containing protein n=1 Tax=Candidatus Electrothrix aestuarii TaxID=3062594 RepID=A0AAU8LXH5_9BACT|nr:PEGA domain-containing protein [Candidatus Electrothrix aestuarii]